MNMEDIAQKNSIFYPRDVFTSPFFHVSRQADNKNLPLYLA